MTRKYIINDGRSEQVIVPRSEPVTKGREEAKTPHRGKKGRKKVVGDCVEFWVIVKQNIFILLIVAETTSEILQPWV